MVPRDAKGNRGTASAQVTLTPKFVEPRLLQRRISWGTLPLNGDFEANSVSGSPPDAFTLNGGSTWGTHAQTTTDVYSGSSAVLFTNTATTTTLTAQPFTVREGEVWVFSIFYKQSASSGSFAGVLAFTYLDASLNAISAVSVNLGGTGVAANTWLRSAQKVVIPSGARFGEMSFSRSGSYSGTLTVDSVDALRGVAFEPWQVPTLENGWQHANLAVYGHVRYRKNDLGEVEFRGVALSSNPAPAANANLLTLPTAYRPDATRLFRVHNNLGTMSDLTVDSLGRVRINAIAADTAITLDGIRFSVD